jgi:hypothetical protein
VKRIKTFRTARHVQQAAAAQREYDQRRARESETRRLYWTARWRRIAKAHLDEHPLCVMCEAEGVIAPATVCDHVTPHRGDVDAFWSGPFQGLCKRHHDSAKQREERTDRRRG